MSAGERVECDRCGCKVNLRADDTYGKHGYTVHGNHEVCEWTGRTYARHMGDFAIVKRNPNVWMCQCRCGDAFLGPEYSDVESQWVEHRAEVAAGVA